MDGGQPLTVQTVRAEFHCPLITQIAPKGDTDYARCTKRNLRCYIA
jgi:hypothetical protein